MGLDFLRQQVDPRNLPMQVVAKWSYSTLEEGFVPFPKKFVRSLSSLFPGESSEELATLLAIIDYKRPNLSRQPSLSYLSYIAGLPEDRFRESLQRLQDKGLIQLESPNEEELEISTKGLLDSIDRHAKDNPFPSIGGPSEKPDSSQRR